MTRLLAILLILSLASAFVLGTGTAQTTTTEVKATQGNRFEPDNITISAGTTVTWVNEGGFHTVTSNDTDDAGDRLFNEQLATEGAEYTHTFDEPGTYDYHCTPHAALGMFGTIIVTEADGGNGNGNETNGDGNGDDTNGSPAPGFAFLLAGLAALVLVYRRR